jgi:hypothetical protein
MNYQNHYDRLIERAKTRIIPKETYAETHHIIPRCQGGSNDKSNLVRLLPEEHLIAHLLLTKINPTDKKLLYAANILSNLTRNKRNTNKMYGWLKRKFSEDQRGKIQIVSDETKIKRCATWKKKYAEGYPGNRTGKSLTDEHKKIISEANKGKTVLTKSKSSLEGYIIRYGEELGRLKYKEDSARKSNSLEATIGRYGEEEGTNRYNARIQAQSVASTGRTASDETKKLMSDLAIQRFQEIDHHAKGTFWITNGTENKRWSDGELPDGFKIGRVFDKPRKPATPPLVIYDADGNAVLSIIKYFQKTIKELGFPSALYYTSLNNNTLYEPTANQRQCDIQRMINTNTYQYKGWYARYMEA